MAEHAVSSRAALGILGTRFGIYPVKIIVTLFVAPLLGTTDYGIYTYLILPGAVLLPLLLFGLSPALRFYVSKGEYSASEVGFPALIMGFVHGLLTAAVTVLLWHLGWLGETGRAISFANLAPVLFVLPLQGASLTMNVVMIGASWFSAMNLYLLLNNLLPPVLLAALVIFGGLGLQGAVWTIFTANGLLALIAISMVFVRFRPEFKVRVRMLVQMYGYGSRAWVGALANRASVRLDQFVLGFVRAPGDLGVYRIAVMVAELLWIIPDAVSIPLFNRVSSGSSPEEQVKITSRSHRVLLVVVVLAAIGLFIVGWWLLPLVLGEEYADTRWLLGLLIPGTVFLVTSRIVNMFFSATGRPEKASMVEIIGAVVSIGAYLAFIPTFGVAGAAIGTSVAYMIIALTASQMFKRSVSPIRAHLLRARREDINWATQLVKDSFAIWGKALKGS